MEKKKISLPPRPDCGSIEINKMIDAVNRGEKVNPCPGSAERDLYLLLPRHASADSLRFCSFVREFYRTPQPLEESN